MVRTIPIGDPLAVAAVTAIHSGDVAGLTQLLSDSPQLATARLGGDMDNRVDGGMSRTLLHVVTDWPGHYPNGSATVAALVGAGADVNAPFVGGHSETALHWAASSDDCEVLDALLDAGADIEARGGCIADGTALFDATVFGQWQAAHRLVERGARCGLWEAAVLGFLPRVRELLREEPAPSAEEITGYFWGACQGGQRETAEYLLARGADLNWVGWDNLTPWGRPGAAMRLHSLPGYTNRVRSKQPARTLVRALFGFAQSTITSTATVRKTDRTLCTAIPISAL